MGSNRSPIVPPPWPVRLSRDEIGAGPELAEAACVVCSPICGATVVPPTCPLLVDNPLEPGPGPLALTRSRCIDPPPARLTPAISIAARTRPEAAPITERPVFIGETPP